MTRSSSSIPTMVIDGVSDPISTLSFAAIVFNRPQTTALTMFGNAFVPICTLRFPCRNTAGPRTIFPLPLTKDDRERGKELLFVEPVWSTTDGFRVFFRAHRSLRRPRVSRRLVSGQAVWLRSDERSALGPLSARGSIILYQYIVDLAPPLLYAVHKLTIQKAFE